MICGGDSTHPTCRKYNKASNTWTTSGSMPQGRHAAAGSFHPDRGLVISGGYSNLADHKSVISTTDGANFRFLPAAKPLVYN